MSAYLNFDGDTYEPELDHDRLATLLDRVRTLMADGRWRTLAAITEVCGGTEASVSARLRDLRKPRFGSHDIERRRVCGSDGLFEYRMAGTIAALPAQLQWSLERDAAGWPSLRSTCGRFTVARVMVPVEGKPMPMYEAWDAREKPARMLRDPDGGPSVYPWQDQAKARAEAELAKEAA